MGVGLALGLLFSTSVGCSLFVDLNGLDTGDASVMTSHDARPDHEAQRDSVAGDRESSTEERAVDAPPPTEAGGDSGVTTVTVASAGPSLFSTGYGYQSHLVFAHNDMRYWLFYVDGTPGVIKTLASKDLLSWSAGASISLKSGYSVADGYSFSVAYANLAGADVVHIVANAVSSGSGAAFHIRAVIAGGVITASTPVTHPDSTGPGPCPNDGPATVIASNGNVYDVTAWVTHAGVTFCDTNIYLSPGPDTGTSWSSGAFSHDGYFVSVPTYAFSHDLVALGSATVLAVWPDQDNAYVSLFDSVGWALSPTFGGLGGPGTTGIAQPAATELFHADGATASLDDWSICALSDTDVRLVRHEVSQAVSGGAPPPPYTVNAFQDVIYDGSTWNPVPPAPSVMGESNTGVALLSGTKTSDGILMITIRNDNALHVAKWTAMGGWTTSATIAGSAPRQSLAGSGCRSQRPAIVWTEGGTAPFAIKSADLSTLLGP